MLIPFIDLKAQRDALAGPVQDRIQQVLDHGRFILGPEVGELEQVLARYVGVKHAVGCASGTDALLLALMALGVGPGDAVFTTPFTFIATAEVVSLLGATPVFVDIDPHTFNLAPDRLEKAVRALEVHDPGLHPLPDNHRDLTARGVIAVDLYGLPAAYDAIGRLCTSRGLFLLADAAQSFGAEYRGRRAGSLGDVAATSFFPAKPLGCYGDGGMVFTDRDDLAETVRSLRVHGKGGNKYDNVRIGLNARLDTLQAAVLLAKFEAFPDEVRRRRELARIYGDALAGLDGVAPPVEPEGTRSAWAQYTLRWTGRDRDGAVQRLAGAGIPAVVYYPKPLHLQTAFRPLGYREGAFPEAERASRQVLSLPFGPYMRPDQVERVVRAVGGEPG